MRIATISYYLPPVDMIGSGMQMHYLANAYAQSGHSVSMFSPYASTTNDALYSCVQVPVGRQNRTLQFAWNLRRQDFRGFDVVHAGMDDYLLLGVPRGYHIRTFHGSCFAEAINIRGARNRIRMLYLGATEWLSCLVADRKVCVSRNTRRYIPFAREVIWNGVDLTLFKPDGPKSPNPSILFVGTMGYRKRGSELLAAFEREVRPQIPDAELWIVRETDPVEAPGVKWYGPVPLEKLVRLYQQAWLFCLPSSYEGFGVPYVEAMACGTPAVATPNPGALEVLASGEFGAIAELPDLGARLRDLLLDEGERMRLRGAGLRRAQEFSWDRVVASYLGDLPRRPTAEPASERVAR